MPFTAFKAASSFLVESTLLLNYNRALFLRARCLNPRESTFSLVMLMHMIWINFLKMLVKLTMNAH